MNADPNSEGGRKIRSVEISLNIIDRLQNEDRLTVGELARTLDHSKSTIHNHLSTLEQRRMIVRDETGYRLSLRLLDMANRVRSQVGNYEVINKEVETLAEETGEIAQFGIEEHGMVSYFEKERGNNSVETASRVGTQQPIYSTSLGKTILAFLPADRVEEIVAEASFEPKTTRTITSSDELYEELERIRDQGYGIDNEENIEGLRCVSAPVTSGDTVLGAISLTGPSSRFTHDKLHDELADAVTRAANVIELNTKFS
ncbi:MULTISPECIES: IclR family transcriptional regulator [Haloferacaceae]|uniref:IclR family transcriptional regulator n=1 Tax=Halorubrum glutamatedens TaxID=2707018 RepID=A0ABD5QR84_9EURY|nr:IclR family transcriptional regulator [Halobellus captivus]